MMSFFARGAASFFVENKSCAFFGHRHMRVAEYRDKLLELIIDLIENEGVAQFYSGFRGDFDVYCSYLIYEIKNKYQHIKNTMVLSYIPDTSKNPDYKFELPKCFDDSVYLLERQVPKRLAIIETNKLIVSKSDYIVAGVRTHYGGAYMALEYAHKKKKLILNVFDGLEL